jgi:predicted secreted protein
MPAIDHAPMHLLARAGQALTIELESIPGAGVTWQLPAAPAGCSLTAADSQPASAGVGGAALQRFVLTCDQAGERRLRFELKRPWESEVRAVQPVVVSVK